MKVCLVCSSGGHLLELYRLKSAWDESQRFWVSFPGQDTNSLLRDERVLHGHHPTNRNLWNLFRNFLVAWRVLRKEQPDVIISTGAGLAIPFVYLGRLFNIPAVYIESLTRTRNLSLTGRLVYPVAIRFLVQWPELAARYRRADFCGRVL